MANWVLSTFLVAIQGSIIVCVQCRRISPSSLSSTAHAGTSAARNKIIVESEMSWKSWCSSSKSFLEIVDWVLIKALRNIRSASHHWCRTETPQTAISGARAWSDTKDWKRITKWKKRRRSIVCLISVRANARTILNLRTIYVNSSSCPQIHETQF